MGRIEGKVALITGAGRMDGIGGATARLFCAEGAKVAIVDLDRASVEATARAIRTAVPGAEVLPLAGDVSQEDDAGRAVSEVLHRYGCLTTLVNNAAIREFTAISQCTPESWYRILGVNLLGVAYCCKAALPALREEKGASIVNVSSVNAIVGRAGMGQYDVTKAGVSSLTRTLAFEEVDHGVRVNAICPGGTLTGYHVDRFRRRSDDIDKLRTDRKENSPMGRWAEPIETAYPILWLASDEASFITGVDLMVDDGMSM